MPSAELTLVVVFGVGGVSLPVLVVLDVFRGVVADIVFVVVVFVFFVVVLWLSASFVVAAVFLWCGRWCCCCY